MPRSEIPLTGAGALTDFAVELRRLRQRAGGIPYRRMAKMCHYSASSLSAAASGRTLPSLTVTLAYVRACGGDLAEWEARWQQVCGALEAQAPTGSGARAVAPAMLGALPPRLAGFIGRGDELRLLANLLAPRADASAGVVVVTAVAGLAGVGKTALTVRAAHSAVDAGHFPGGVLFVDLRGYDEAPVGANQALEALLRELGVRPERIPSDLEERAALYRSQLAARAGAVLVIADNVSMAQQVRPLVPGHDRHRVVATSRHTLPTLGARLVDLAVLPEDEAVALLDAALRAARPSDGRIEAEPAAAAQLARWCGCLPLALQIAAALLVVDPDQPVASLTAELADTGRRLTRLDDGEWGVRAAFELSYQRLTADQARLFRLLGLHPGPDITAPVAAVLADQSERDAREALVQLARAHMLERTSVPGRWRLHDLIRAYASELAEDIQKDDNQDATGRLLDYYLDATRSADQHLIPDGAAGPVRSPALEEGMAAVSPRLADTAQALAWLAAERANLHACAVHAAAGFPTHAVRIAHAAARFLDQAGHWRQAHTLHQAAAQIAHTSGDSHAHATALNDLGRIQDHFGDYEAATASLTQALTLFRRLDDQRGQAEALIHLSDVQQRPGDYEAAADGFGQALTLFRQLDDQRGQANALVGLGQGDYLTGQLPAAADCFLRALALFRELDDRRGLANALRSLGDVQQYIGAYQAAADSLTQALALFRELDDRRGQAHVHRSLNIVQRLTGQYEAATDNLTQALELCQQLDDRNGHTCARAFLGVVQHMTGQYAEAADNLRYALDTFRRIGDRGGEVEVLNYYAALVAATDTPADGRALHEDALRLAREIGAGWDEANALAGIAATHRAEGDAAQAGYFYQQALTLYQATGCQADVTRIQAILMEL